MEQNITDLKRIEEETKEKVSRVNCQKVALVKALVESVKVSKLVSEALELEQLQVIRFHRHAPGAALAL